MTEGRGWGFDKFEVLASILLCLKQLPTVIGILPLSNYIDLNEMVFNNMVTSFMVATHLTFCW